MKREFHEQESIKLFGKPFTEVHAWLDGLSWKNGKLDVNHRKFRHTMEGVIYIHATYGKLARQAAIRHIISDLTGAGWTTTDGIPKNTKEYDKIFNNINIVHLPE